MADEMRPRDPAPAPAPAPAPDKSGAAGERRLVEPRLGFVEAVRLYPKAMGWSAFVSLGIVMAAFDPQLVGNLYATPAFQRDFGRRFRDEFIIDASWQTALGMGSPIGQVVGALFAAYPMDAFGRKRTLAVCLVATGGLVLIQFLARAVHVLLVGELLAGLVLGNFYVIAPAYASEVCPTALRGHMASYVNLCFVTGQLLANGVTAATQRLSSHWAYSIPFALQWLFVLLLGAGLGFVPESPWWLARSGRLADAERSLARLASPDVPVASTLAYILETDRLEQLLEAGSTFRDCFRPVNLRRTEISSGVYCTQVLSGIYLANYATFFFQRAGLATDQAFNMSLVIGILDCVPGRPPGAIWAESSLLLLWNFVYDVTIGPVCFVVLSECSATRVRSKTIALATAAQGLISIAMTVAIPYMIKPAEANMQGKLGFFFGGLGGLCLLWSYFRVPETAGRTFDELDLLFDRNVPARKFKSHQLEGAISPGAGP